MTVESRLVVGIEDIRAISLECTECKTRLSCLPDTLNDVPHVCPKCRHPWLPSDRKINHEFADPSPVQFVKAVAQIRALSREVKVGFRILLEFDAPGSARES